MSLEVECAVCAEVVSVAAPQEGETTTCPSCGAQLTVVKLKSPAPPAGGGATQHLRYGTLFQPGIMMDSILRDADTEPSRETQARPRRSPWDPGPQPAPGGVEAYLVMPGAPRGEERFQLAAARTVLGRGEADLAFDDPEMSARHCQIEVIGNEFFVRDLESRGGVFLNGHRVRYSQMLPGDELRLGATTLVFRTADDGVS